MNSKRVNTSSMWDTV